MEPSEPLNRNVSAGRASLVIGLFLLLNLFLGIGVPYGAWPLFLNNRAFALIYFAIIVIIALVGFNFGKKSKTTVGKIGIVLIILGTIINLLYSFGIYIMSDFSW